jgi:hypothetical protein
MSKSYVAYVECSLENLVAEGAQVRIRALASNREELLHMQHAQLSSQITVAKRVDRSSALLEIILPQ